ncbi:hemerythrin domain-containing protein [Intrasporangium calvum]|uniref:Hemerythrin HHE cation binding domain protein n=1 Tax=Intrasporangium calvum (strain ATCC 23552 / DSM 43043 / JCM 3097 / NBRC 12989 / NCIMB 10167 / NRRL B-3866 / 7 KIP) TaxID=710696 RepID=E6SFE3_INTC7|nr:hemerythrin domain-containing protein [Intrasporangium calvum]ADU46681.1 Hemerythrin HHE cation binding domain protein [Intrasporangium calvum DSM 43043]
MCSYCGCRDISLIGRFMTEHEEIVNVAGVLHRAVEGHGPDSVAEALGHTLAHLHPHTTAEERGLFAVLRRNPDFTEHIDGLCAEHARLDDLAERIRGGDTALVNTFYDELRDHIDKEDNGLFPAAAIEMDGPDWVEAIQLTPDEGPHTHDEPHDDTH